MRCLLIEPHLAAFVDGELDEATRAAVEDHLRECRSCRETVRDIKLSSAVLNQWKPGAPTVPMVEALRKRILDESDPSAEIADEQDDSARPMTSSRRGGWNALRWIAAAALVLIVFGIGTIAWQWIVEPASSRASLQMASIGRTAIMASKPQELRTARISLAGVLGDQWAEPRPDVGRLIQLEVVSTMMATTKDPRRMGDAGRVLQMMGHESRAARMRRGAEDFASATGECFSALFSMSASRAEAPVPDLETLLDEATKLEEGGDLEGAVEKYRAAGEDRVLTLRANILQANLEMKLGRAQEAVEALNRAYQLTKPDTFYREVVVELSARAKRAIDIQHRIDALKSELLKTEKEFDVLSDIGNLQVKAGNLKGAEETFGRVAREGADRGHEKDVLRARLVKAWCAREMNRPSEAFDELNGVIADAREVYPDVAALAQFERAKTLQLRGRSAQAVDDYRALARDNPTLGPGCLAAIQFQVGYILLNDLDRPDEARQTFQALQQPATADQAFACLAAEIMKDCETAK